jgi:Cu/Ag efflux protein CusF
MTMDFALGADLDAAKVTPGSQVEFDFVDTGSGVFAIVDVRPVGGVAPVAGGPEAWTVAKINGPGAADGQVNVTHEPIPALGWPAMTMDLGVDASVPPDMIAPGKRLRIGLAKGKDGLYRIVAAEPDAGGS